jgi:hypothetical protein
MESRVGVEPTIEVLQTSSLPLAYRDVTAQYGDEG